MKNAIIQVVKRHNGIKAEKLELDVIDQRWPLSYESKEYKEAISELINSGELIKLEYINPDENDKKSLYFLKETTLLLTFKGWCDIARNPDKTIMDGESKRDT